MDRSYGSQPRGQNQGSHVGKKLRMKGKFAVQEALTIAGSFEGEVRAGSHTVTVSEGAVVAADIKAGEVSVEGKLRGDVKGNARIQLTATADVQGKMETRKLSVEEGAVFRGQVDIMTQS